VFQGALYLPGEVGIIFYKQNSQGSCPERSTASVEWHIAMSPGRQAEFRSIDNCCFDPADKPLILKIMLRTGPFLNTDLNQASDCLKAPHGQ
jgi:hypothetical protein